MGKIQKWVILYPDLSYRVVAASLSLRGIQYASHAFMPIQFRKRNIGKSYLDFLIEDRIILEIKRDARIRRPFIDQAPAYLRSTDHRLAMLANVSPNELEYT